MIDFSAVKELVIPEGVVASIACAGKVLWQKLALPPEYVALEYLEGTGTQYIDTGIMLTSNHSVELDYQIKASPQYRTGLFGGLFTGSIRYGSLLSPSNAALEHGYGTSNVYWQQGIPDLERHVFRQEKNKIYVDGALVHTFAAATFSTTVTAKLGTFDYTNYKPAQARYFRSRWWEGDKLVRDFLPCYRKNDGKPGLYDTVSKSFFTNAGTGEFVFEKPAYKRELAYLESTGAQWINTGICPTDSSIKSEVKIAYSSTNTGQLMGAGTAGTERFNFGVESGKFRFGFGGSWFDANSEVKTPDTAPHIWVLDAEAKAGYIDGVEQKTTNTYLPGGSRAFVLFARGSNVNSAESGNRTKGKLYYAKLWNAGTLVRDFIPVIDWSDVPCMYDKVSGELFYNAGSGEFLYGEKMS